MLWEMNHPEKDYLDDIPINVFIDKSALLDFIISECGDMTVVDDHSEVFYYRVKTFFRIHKWNIDKLCESMNFEYQPLNNYHGTEDSTKARDIAFKSVTDRDQTDDTVTDRDQVQDKTTDRDQTESEKTDRDISTVENGEKHQKGTDDTTTDRDWTESGKTNETDVHFISAFNEKESPELIGYDSDGYPIYKYNDTEHDRDSISSSYSKKGTEDINVLTDRSTDETHSLTNTVDDDTQRTETITEDIINKDTIREDISKKNTISEDITKDDVTDEDIVNHISREGNNGKSYQSLIEEERQQAQFNIYKWILNHWFHEMVVSVW